MNEPENRVLAIFAEAMEIADAEARKEYPSKACGADQALRKEVEELLEAEAQAGRFLPDRPQGRPGAHSGTDASAAPLTAHMEQIGDRIGRYKLLQKIGEGGCGIVYMAEQELPFLRKVALKVIKLGMDTRSVVARFEAERQALALMDHPNIAKVLDAGASESGRPYFVMELVRGRKITQYCDEQRLSTRHRLDLFIQVCQAVQHAHQKGVIHRDIKPSNILVTERDGIPVVKVIDFGIAKATGDLQLTDKTLFTAFEQFIGTPAYMSPEQARLGELDIDTRSDIYSLGVLLYELLTGQPPFEAARLKRMAIDEVLKTIRETDPPLPSNRFTLMTREQRTTVARSRQVEPSALPRLVRGDLDWIAMKCLEKDRTRRYETANGLLRDIQRHFNYEPVVARPPCKFYRFQKMIKRNKLGFTAVSAVAASLIIGLGISVWQFIEKNRAYIQAVAAERERTVSNGMRAMESGDLLGALPYYAEALRLDQGSSEEASVHRLRFGATLAQCPKLTQLWTASMRVDDAEFSPDGNSVVVTEHYYGKATVYDLKTGALYLRPFGPTGLTAASYSPDGQLILTSSQDAGAMVWNAHTLTRVLQVTNAARLLYARFSVDGDKILGAYTDNTARVLDAKTGRLELELKGHTNAVLFVTMSRDGQRLATGSRDGSARIWDATTGLQIGKSLWPKGWVMGVAFSPDGRRVVTACIDHRAEVWDLETGQRVFPVLEHDDVVSNVEFSPDGRLILTASFDGTVRFWRANDLRPFGTNPILRHNDRVTHAAFSPDGRLILTACLDGTIRVWDLAGGLIPPVPMQRWFSPDASRFLTISNGTLQVWDSLSAKAVSSPMRPVNPPLRAELSYDGRFLLTESGIPAGEDGTNWFLQPWSVSLGRPVGPQIVISNRLDGAVVSQDGTKLAIWSGPKAQSFEIATGAELSPPLEHRGPISFARFTPQGNRLVTVEKTNVFVWDSLIGRLVFPAIEHPVPVGYLDFSRDGLKMVTCCSDDGLTKCFAQIWRVADGQPVGDILEHGDGVLFAAFSQDGHRLVTTGEDNSAKMWETDHGTQIGQSIKHRDQVSAAALSSRARYLATASADNTARIWDSERDDPLTPPLLHPISIVDVKFLPDDKSIVTADRNGNTWIWLLKSAEMPLDQLIIMANLLSGTTVQPVNRAVRKKQEPIGVTWQRLRAQHVAAFSTSPEEVIAWHRFQAEDSELNHQWFAATFHLKQLLSLTSANESIASRLATDTAHLAAGD